MDSVDNLFLVINSLSTEQSSIISTPPGTYQHFHSPYYYDYYFFYKYIKYIKLLPSLLDGNLNIKPLKRKCFGIS